MEAFVNMYEYANLSFPNKNTMGNTGEIIIAYVCMNLSLSLSKKT